MIPAVVVGVILLTAALPAAGQSSIIERERARRAEAANRAQDELRRGDKAYEAGNYAEAVEAFGAARALLPDSQLTGELRAAATQRLVQASVERARQLAKGGQMEEAHSLLDSVLAPEIAPNDPSVLEMKGRIDDPIRTNPALTAEHVRNIDQVRRLLYEAEGFTDLGQFDRAHVVYEQVLQIDPTNVAARRGMEKASNFRSDAAGSAYDETRARLLMQVDEQWEIKPTQAAEDAGLELGLLQDPNLGRRTAEEKLRTLIVPMVDLEQVDLIEAVDFLRDQSMMLDTGELDPNRKGFSVVVDLGTGESPVARRITAKRFNLKLRSVPLGTLLEYINAATGTQARIDEFAVVIRPLGAVSEDMYTREWRVPPDFLSRGAISNQNQDDDPFALDDAKPGLLGKRLTAEEFLKQQGVSFPEGSSASFSPINSILKVRNTTVNLDYVEQVVDAAIEKEPVVVVVEATFINATNESIEELGYDWLISPSDIGGDDLFIGGGTTGNGQPFDDFGPGQVDPITSGIRSGDRATGGNSIDALINNVRQSSPRGTFAFDSLGGGGLSAFDPPSGGRPGETDFRAPGVVGLVGVYDEETIAGLLRGLGNKKGVDLMTKKSVITRSGQSAVIESVREFIYPTEYEPPELPNSVGGTSITDLATGESVSPINSIATPSTPTAFDTTKLGCVLEVEPLVDPTRNYVEVAVKPMVRRFDGFINYGTPILGGTDNVSINLAGIGNPLVPSFFRTTNFGEITPNEILMPVFSTITSNSNLTIADGQTIVMGGLLRSERVKVEDKVPILGDIPLVGRFFQSEAETDVQSSLVIFVTVKLLDPSGQPFRDR